MMGWSQLGLREREQQYSPSSCLPDGDYRPLVARYRQASEKARKYCLSGGREIVEIRYGDGSAQTIDVVTPNDSGGADPLLVFIHGGYWQELSKHDSFFAATDCIQHGWGFAAVDYTLAPHATLDEIVEECAAAIEALYSEADRLGFDHRHLFIAGSSAGAHLAAMAALRQPNNTPPIAGLVLLSGIYEIEPLIRTSINAAVGIDPPAADRNSPLRHRAEGLPPALVAWGENETDEFKAQSRVYAHHLRAGGVAVAEMEISDRNHFDLVLDLAAPDTQLGNAVTEFVTTQEPANADL
ncbi:MAG: alpha/beta hydrolase [Actinomycetia bacterium]|nr:alpha/beta hydrolase [Actinomycetes bacterium]